MTPSTGYRIIELTQGQVTLVDEDDFEQLSKFKWHAHWSDLTQSYYAMRNISGGPGGPRQRLIRMHRVIMGLSFGDKSQVDHSNHDTLDNRKGNLTVCRFTEQMQNRRRFSSNTSGYKGVHFHKHRGMFCASITANGKRHHLGYRYTAIEAYELYCAAAIELHTKFARLV